MDELSSGERWEARQPERPLRSSAAVTLIGGASYVGMLVSAVRSVVVMAYLGPHRRGVQRWVQLLKSYLANAGIAFRHGVSKELPMAVGAGDEERAAEIEDAGFTSVLLVTALTAVGMLVYALLFAGPDRETRTAYAAGAGILLAEELVVLYFCVLRSWGNFGILALADLVRTAAYFTLVAGGAVLLGLTGVMVGWLVGALVVLAYLEVGSRLVVAIDLDWGRIARLALVGLPVALISFSDLLLRSVDGTILVRYYGLEQFGLYSMAMQMAAYLFAIPQSAGFVIWPRVLESYGAKDETGGRRRRVLLPTIAAAGIMPVVAGMAYLGLPPAIELLIPRFADSVPAAQVLGMGSVLLALPLATNSALVASNREAVVIGTKLAGAALAGGLTWHLVTRAAPLEQVALAACLGFGLAAVLSLLVQLRDFYPQPAARTREVLLALVPLAWSVGALWSARRLVMMAGMEPVTVHGAVLALLAFVVLSAPCLLYAHLRTGAGGELLELLRGRFRH
jgi:O-antigen/teichoic acid export membrane protein